MFVHVYIAFIHLFARREVGCLRSTLPKVGLPRELAMIAWSDRGAHVRV
jgi:hypothetical protein